MKSSYGRGLASIVNDSFDPKWMNEIPIVRKLLEAKRERDAWELADVATFRPAGSRQSWFNLNV